MLYSNIDDYIKNLKDRVNAEMARRTAPYGGVSNLGNEKFSKDIGENQVIEPEFTNKTTSRLMELSDYGNNIKYNDDQLGSNVDMLEDSDLRLKELESEDIFSGNSCRGLCSGMCTGTCFNQCHGCTETCTGGCVSCSGGCGSGCTSGCETTCTGGCGSACTGGCGANCANSCGGTCTGTCATGCSGCSNTCTGSCWAACGGGCTTACTGSCGGGCSSCGGCAGSCSGSCSGGCSGSCSSKDETCDCRSCANCGRPSCG